MPVADHNGPSRLISTEDLTELHRRYKQLFHIVRLPGDGTLSLVGRPSWVAVPQPHGLPSTLEAERIARLCEREEPVRLWGLALEYINWRDADGHSVQVGPHSLDVDSSREGIMTFVHAVSPHHYALLPENNAWAIITMEREDCQMVLGPPETVGTILGRRIVEAYADFASTAQRYRERSSNLADAMENMLHRLRDDYPAMGYGEELVIAAMWATWNPLEHT